MPQSRRGAVLPELDHPVSRWFGVASAGMWAVGVQSLPDPWSKMLALLTPGFGYTAGYSLDAVRKWYAGGQEHRQRERARRKEIRQIRKTIRRLGYEIVKMRCTREGPDLIRRFEEARNNAREVLVRIIAG
jgi:hypothetical protein